jgi:hypothetical protein
MTSKYNIALIPTLPTFLILFMLAIPLTIVQKTTGAIIILTNLIKPSPRGFSLTANAGYNEPRVIPISIAIMT